MQRKERWLPPVPWGGALSKSVERERYHGMLVGRRQEWPEEPESRPV